MEAAHPQEQRAVDDLGDASFDVTALQERTDQCGTEAADPSDYQVTTEFTDAHPNEFATEPPDASAGKTTPTVKPLPTAAELAGLGQQAALQVSPDVFAQGMAVLHPEHGLGKIVALSGAGRNRRASVRFATAGEKRFVLAHSPLRPAGQ
jgi:DNA helicase-2/ATP-dependent DNA helicase PcrA